MSARDASWKKNVGTDPNFLYAETTYQEFGKIRKLEPCWDTPNDEGRLHSFIHVGKVEGLTDA